MTATTAPRSSDADLLQQVRDVVERSLADPEYAQAIRELALAGDPDEALPVLPRGVVDGLAGIELTLQFNPFNTKVSPVDRSYLDSLPDALRAFVARTQVDAEFAEYARVTAERTRDHANGSHLDALRECVGLFARSTDELAQLMPVDDEGRGYDTTTVTTSMTTTTITTTTTTTTVACTTTTTGTTLTTSTTFTTLTNFCPHVKAVDG